MASSVAIDTSGLGPTRGLVSRRIERRTRACVLATVLVMTGCSLAPRYDSPALPVAASYPADVPIAAAQSTAGDASAATIGWRDYFADEQLHRVIAQALENSRDLRSVVLRVEEARSAYGIQRADLFPSIAIAASGSRGRVPGDLNVTGQSRLGSEYRVGPSLAAWEIDFWGRVRNLKDAALETFLATDAASRAATLGLITRVADAYVVLRALDERIALADRTIQSREESYRIFNRRFQVGATSRLDLTQVETLLQQAQTLGAQLRQERASAMHALTLLVGSPVELAAADRSLDERVIARDVDAGLPSELLVARPDIVAAEHRLRAAHASIGAARAAFLPRIALTGSFGSASSELDGLFESGSRAWSFTPTLSLPIFTGGRNRAGLDLAEVRRELAVADYERTIQVAFRDVADALSARGWLAEQVRIGERTLATQSERARLAQLRYESGAAAYLEVLDSQRDLLSAEQQVVQLRRALLSSRVALYAALGGGTQQSP